MRVQRSLHPTDEDLSAGTLCSLRPTDEDLSAETPRSLHLAGKGLSAGRPWPQLRRWLSCWNWKCALMSATARSVVYLIALGRGGVHDRLAVVLVEIGYVALTGGVYAGLQQRALSLRSRALGNAVVVLGVPALAQALDWAAHRVTGATVTAAATMAVAWFAVVSALFHLYVMRNGVFLTGEGRSLGSDFRRIPRLVAGLVMVPVKWFARLRAQAEAAAESVVESEAA